MEKWHQPETIALWLTLGLLFVLLMATAVILLAYGNFRKTLEAKLREHRTEVEHRQNLLDIQERERGRIAADLHDNLISKLAGIRLKMSLGHSAQETERMLQESIVDARRISHDLSPPLAEYKSLAELIKEMLTPWYGHFTVRFHEYTQDAGIITPEVKIQLLRILQELVSNAYKHASADQLSVFLRQSRNGIVMRLCDNGCGYNPAEVKGGLGTRNIEMRIRYLKGRCRLRTEPGKGTQVLILLPYTEPV